MSRTIKFAFAAIALSAAFAPSALAQKAGGDGAIRIAYGDLNLSSAAGGETLLRRISGAARKVCGNRSDYSQLNPHGVSQCRHDTVAAAVSGMGIETLTQAWNGKQASATQVASR